MRDAMGGVSHAISSTIAGEYTRTIASRMDQLCAIAKTLADFRLEERALSRDREFVLVRRPPPTEPL